MGKVGAVMMNEVDAVKNLLDEVVALRARAATWGKKEDNLKATIKAIQADVGPVRDQLATALREKQVLANQVFALNKQIVDLHRRLRPVEGPAVWREVEADAATPGRVGV